MKLQDGQPLVLDIAGAEVSLSAAVITEMFLDRLRAQGEPVMLTSLQVSEHPPALGAKWNGGVYAGVARGVDGTGDHHLIVLDQAPDEIKWQAAINWAESVGGVLPTRRELALCYANVPELFEKTWYWTSEQYAGVEASAWFQGFGSGSQNYGRKGLELRARAVRRLTI